MVELNSLHHQASDAALAGIISTAPGITLGPGGEIQKPVALVGRVPVKINLEGGEIAIGDPIALFDEDTGDAFCLKIKGGELVRVATGRPGPYASGGSARSTGTGTAAPAP